MLTRGVDFSNLESFYIGTLIVLLLWGVVLLAILGHPTRAIGNIMLTPKS